MYVKFWTLYTMHGIVRHPRALYKKKKKKQNINLELVSRRGRKKKSTERATRFNNSFPDNKQTQDHKTRVSQFPLK